MNRTLFFTIRGIFYFVCSLNNDVRNVCGISCINILMLKCGYDSKYHAFPFI